MICKVSLFHYFNIFYVVVALSSMYPTIIIGFIHYRLLINALCIFYVIYVTITKTRLFKYIENFTTKKKKKENFKIKKSDIFHISAKNIDCRYSLEPPRRGGSNEYSQSLFWAEIRKIIYTHVNPSFTI